jgi:DNA repair protein RecN (Recombination protein N)
MLAELRIRNIAVIDSVALPFAPALNVLSGETGAGKSLIVGALGLLLGDRAGGDRLRSGAERGTVEGIFELGGRDGARLPVWDLLDARGIDLEGGTVVLKREVSANGRTRAWINGTPVTIGVLSEVGARLVSVHGQHEAQHLLAADVQRDVLDRFAGAREIALVVAQQFAQLSMLRERAAHRATIRRDAERRADYLRFVVAEISAATPLPGEDEKLEADIRLLSHAQEIRELSAQAAMSLDGDDETVLSRLRDVRKILTSLSRFDSNAETWLATLDETSYTLDELAREIADAGDSAEANPVKLRAFEARRDTLHQLFRKYGPTIEEVLSTLESSRAELNLVDGGELEEAELASEIAEGDRALATSASELSRLRSTGAQKLRVAVSGLLPELGMVDGAFAVALDAANPITANGGETVQFQVALNGGSEFRPLARIASGGELARVMLALSTVLARLQEVPTLVFDEVDAGVGGTVAWQVGALMRRVAGHHQVLAISHLAQIAARAHHHVVVRKAAVGGVTTSDTSVVTDDDRVVEIARMLGGDAEREVSRAHARELLQRGARDDADLPPPATTVGSGDGGKPNPASALPVPPAQRRGKRV